MQDNIRFTLENGQVYNSKDKRIILLLPELLEENKQKVREIQKSLTIDKYNKINKLHEGLSLVNKDGLYGYINYQGEEVIPCMY